MAEATIGALRVVLGADSAAFEKQMAGISSKMKAIGDGLKVAGAGLTAGLTLPLVKFGQAALGAYQESEKAIAAVEAALKSTGGAAGKTSAQLQEMAAKLQSISTFDDDEILSKVTANMLTFGNVTGESFDRAQQAALDLSARLGQDLQSSAIQVGKALNDPIKGIAALGRVGVQFSKDQKAMIKALMETGDVAGAQKIILDELFKQFGGQAQAAANTTAGAWAQMTNSIGDAMEAVGAIIAPFVKSFAEFIKGLAEAFSSLDPSTQQFIVAVGAAAAAIGPLLLALGFILPALSALAPIFGLITAPVAIFVAAIALVSFTLDQFGISFSQQWEAINIAFGGIIEFFGNQIQVFVKLFQGDFAGAWEAFKVMVSGVMNTVVQIVNTLFPGVIATIRGFIQQITQAFVNMKNIAVQAMADLYNGAKTWLMDKLSAAFDFVIEKLGLVNEAFKWLKDQVVGHSHIPDMVKDSTAWLKDMGVSMDRIGGDAVSNWNANMASMSSANASISTSESASVSAANDNAGGGGMGRGRGDIYLGGVTINAADAASFKQSKGQVQADLSDMVRAAFAGR
jgi:hypothetical protein